MVCGPFSLILCAYSKLHTYFASYIRVYFALASLLVLKTALLNSGILFFFCFLYFPLFFFFLHYYGLLLFWILSRQAPSRANSSAWADSSSWVDASIMWCQLCKLWCETLSIAIFKKNWEGKSKVIASLSLRLLVWRATGWQMALLTTHFLNANIESSIFVWPPYTMYKLLSTTDRSQTV